MLIQTVVNLMDLQRDAYRLRTYARGREVVPPLGPSQAEALRGVGRELLESIESWPSFAAELVDPSNVMFPRLLQPQDRWRGMRRPRITMQVSLTSAGNLVMEWQPVRSAHDCGWDMDFLVPPIGSRGFTGPPMNRVVMIRHFRDLMELTPVHPRLLGMAEAVRAHLASVRDALSNSVEIDLLSDLFVSEGETESDPIRIESLQARHERHRARVRSEILARLEENGTTLERFLADFRRAGQKFKEFAWVLKSSGWQLKTQWNHGEDWQTVRSFVYRVYAYFPEEYDRVCKSLSAQGAREMRARAQSATQMYGEADSYCRPFVYVDREEEFVPS